ncbi:HET-domain-containing protein [Lepidopterella palustris CBS 459.81]|uniref:HET-domain-containing protein n=1 Tax=Lepidopterella palustris CBS 459.81 TaxID=1314670 RepID=A0A8E2ECS2_9PEZI|nr:HET-domain-containing protein [Lepidopterella palustris CBS 459.81]
MAKQPPRFVGDGAEQVRDRYDYSTLSNQEIRIITLLPGQFDDDIRLTIYQTKLVEPEEQTQVRMTLKELKKTMPPGWAVHETPQLKFVFECIGDPTRNSYIHPDPTIDRSAYERPLGDKYWDFIPQYEALSYVWGPPGDRKTVFFESDDGSSATPHSVRISLHTALRHLRYQDKPRRLWVDALCINQADNDEKPDQVRRMAAIFALASRVIAWFGPEENDSALALSTIENLGKQIEVTVEGRRLPAPDAPKIDWNVDNDKENRVPHALASLMTRTFFERLWVVQELTLANRLAILQCGKDTVLWELFRRCISYLDQMPDLRSDKLRELVFLHRHWGQSQHGAPLEWLLREHKSKACTDPRDKVYGLMGIFPPEVAAAIHPDYSSPVSDTYRSTLLAHISQTQRWEVFGCDLPDRQVPGPSWVPDLLAPFSNAWDSRRQFAAGYSRIQAVYSDETPDLLQVTGVHCATIRSATDDTVPNDPLKALQFVRSWEPSNLYTAGYPTGETLLEAYASIFIQHTFQDRWPMTTEHPSMADWLEQKHGAAVFGPRARAGSPDDKFDLGTFLGHRSFVCVRGRSFITTEEGHVGLGPKGVKPGDMICIILGCDRPLVLRPLNGSDGHFQLIGDSFIHGLSDGIGILGPFPKPWIAQGFEYPEIDLRCTFKFFNAETGEVTPEDPRLESQTEWERIDLETLGRRHVADDPVILDFFRNKSTGEIMDSDPRMLPEALEKRGVKLRKFVIA